MSITAGYCVLAVLLFRAVLRRQPKIYSYLLWVSVFFRLACPVSVSSQKFWQGAAKRFVHKLAALFPVKFFPAYPRRNFSSRSMR